MRGFCFSQCASFLAWRLAGKGVECKNSRLNNKNKDMPRPHSPKMVAKQVFVICASKSLAPIPDPVPTATAFLRFCIECRQTFFYARRILMSSYVCFVGGIGVGGPWA